MTVSQLRPYLTALGNNSPNVIWLYTDHEDLFNKAQGSRHNHQAWPGGFIQHVWDTIEIASMIYNQAVANEWPMPFNIQSVALVLSLHDIEKPFMQQDSKKFWTKQRRASFRKDLIQKYNIILADEEEKALQYIEGEGNDYSPTERNMNELGALCHAADVLSARLWHSRNKLQ